MDNPPPTVSDWNYVNPDKADLDKIRKGKKQADVANRNTILMRMPLWLTVQFLPDGTLRLA